MSEPKFPLHHVEMRTLSEMTQRQVLYNTMSNLRLPPFNYTVGEMRNYLRTIRALAQAGPDSDNAVYAGRYLLCDMMTHRLVIWRRP